MSNQKNICNEDPNKCLKVLDARNMHPSKTITCITVWRDGTSGRFKESCSAVPTKDSHNNFNDTIYYNNGNKGGGHTNSI